MTTDSIRSSYLNFYKTRDHAIVPSASLVPENDPTTLFTGSGMQPMIPYLLGAKHPEGTRIVDSQKCIRAQDIEEVGDNRHTTFFEMLGNWSLGDYFKKEQIPWIFKFLTGEIGLDPDRLYVTCFRGNSAINIQKDEESAKIWQEVFAEASLNAKIVDHPETRGMQNGRVFYYDETKNWWSRSGAPSHMPAGEPGGPDSEMFWDFGEKRGLHERSTFKNTPCHVNCDCGRFLEIGNSVFMEYIKTDTDFEKLTLQNVDFGGGLERITAARADNPDIFTIDLFSGVIARIEEITKQSYKDAKDKKPFRVIADHLRAVVFLIGDERGVNPSNTDRGYIVRRLLRRAIRFGRHLKIQERQWLNGIAEIIVSLYKESYPELTKHASRIYDELMLEEERFKSTLEKGLKKLSEYTAKLVAGDLLPSSAVFELYSTYGFPIEMTREIVKERGIAIDEVGVGEEFKKHQEISRNAALGKFKGGLADNTEKTTRLHTATHLLNEALRIIVDPNIRQRGSNIREERLRFDFNLNRKLADDEIKKVEGLINEKIAAKIPVTKLEMPLEEALETGAQSEFGARYPKRVTVYSIGNFSKEICGGPHVANTSELRQFKITKEESCGAGVRRIKAILI